MDKDVCLTPRKTFEHCKGITCYEMGCLAINSLAQCSSRCSRSCRNSPFTVCISLTTDYCDAKAGNFRIANYTCPVPIIPLWATILLGVLAVILLGLLIGLVIKFNNQRIATNKIVQSA